MGVGNLGLHRCGLFLSTFIYLPLPLENIIAMVLLTLGHPLALVTWANFLSSLPERLV